MRILRLLSLSEPAYAHELHLRFRVFVQEQGVPLEEEVDEYERTSTHYVVYADAHDEAAVGCGRWRTTPSGIKIERIAVLAPYRRQGIATHLIKRMIKDIKQTYPKEPLIRIYLHAQQQALTLYTRIGFQPYGEPFDECRIAHIGMQYLQR